MMYSRFSSNIEFLPKFSFRYPVSNFSYSLLDRMSTDPLFNVLDLNSSLYRQVRELQRVRLLRIALFYLKDFIFSCRCTGTYVVEKMILAYVYIFWFMRIVLFRFGWMFQLTKCDKGRTESYLYRSWLLLYFGFH